MSETNNTAAPAAGNASAAAPAASTPAATAPATPAAAPAAPATPAAAEAKKPGVKGAQAAFNRVKDRAAASKAAAAPKTPAAPAAGSEQAPAGTPTPAAGAATAPAAQAAGEAAAAAAPSTVDTPKDWPEAHRARFEKLPQEGRALVLDIQKDFQRGLTIATNKLAEMSRGNQEAIETAKQFQADPKATILALAKRAGIEVFLEKPAAAGKIPEFKTTEEMAQWAADEAAKRTAETLRTEREQAAAETAKKAADDGLRAEFQQASKDHADFATHKEKVLDILSQTPDLSVDNAYRLATYEGLKKLAQDGDAAVRELAALKATIETERKRATAPTPPAPAGKSQGDTSHLSAAQRAFSRASARART